LAEVLLVLASKKMARILTIDNLLLQPAEFPIGSNDLISASITMCMFHKVIIDDTKSTRSGITVQQVQTHANIPKDCGFPGTQ
jgi:hypothetical protein